MAPALDPKALNNASSVKSIPAFYNFQARWGVLFTCAFVFTYLCSKYQFRNYHPSLVLKQPRT